jgi:ABC-type transporter Mla subunit MlaD
MSRLVAIRALIGTLAAAVVVLGAFALLSGSPEYMVRAEFANVDGLRPQYTVRIGTWLSSRGTPRDRLPPAR